MSFFGLAVISAGLAVTPASFFSSMSPLAASSLRARPSLVVSLGTATVAPVFELSRSQTNAAQTAIAAQTTRRA